MGIAGVKIHDRARLKAEPVKTRCLRGGGAIVDQLLTHFHANDGNRERRDSGKIVIERKIEIAFARPPYRQSGDAGL